MSAGITDIYCDGLFYFALEQELKFLCVLSKHYKKLQETISWNVLLDVIYVHQAMET